MQLSPLFIAVSSSVGKKRTLIVMKSEDLLLYLQEPEDRIMGLAGIWGMVISVARPFCVFLRRCCYVIGWAHLQEIALDVVKSQSQN